MRDRIRRFAPIIITAALVWAATTTGPSIASAVYDAVNARKVDGLSAVTASASIKHRAGKLVAANEHGRLPGNIIKTAPNAANLGGLPLKRVRTQWLSVASDGGIIGSSPAASGITVTHPAVGTFCVSSDGIVRESVSGNVQSYVNGFEDLTMIVTSLYNTGQCPGDFRIYTTLDAALNDEPFTLTFAFS